MALNAALSSHLVLISSESTDTSSLCRWRLLPVLVAVVVVVAVREGVPVAVAVEGLQGRDVSIDPVHLLIVLQPISILSDINPVLDHAFSGRSGYDGAGHVVQPVDSAETTGQCHRIVVIADLQMANTSRTQLNVDIQSEDDRARTMLQIKEVIAVYHSYYLNLFLTSASSRCFFLSLVRKWNGAGPWAASIRLF